MKSYNAKTPVYVILVNDLPVYAVSGSKQFAENQNRTLRRKGYINYCQLYGRNKLSYKGYRTQYFWHIHEVPFITGME